MRNVSRSRVVTWLVQHRMSLAFSLAAGLLVAIAVIAVVARDLVEQYETVRHTTEDLTELDRVLSAVTDAESEQRGFLITGDERYLTSYLAAAGAADAHYRTLRALTTGDSRRQQHVDALEPLIRDRLAELRDAIALRRREAAGAAGRPAVTDRGRQQMAEIRSIVAAMKEEDRALLTAQSAHHAGQVRQTFLALSALAAVTFLTLAVLLAESRRRAGEIRLTRDALQLQVAEHEKTTSLLAALVQSSDDAIIGHGLDGRILTWNRGAQRIYGFSEGEARGRTMDMLVPPGQPAEIPALLDRIRRGETVEHLETEHVTKDGRRIHVLLTLSPIRDVADRMVGASIVARDITAQKLADEARRRSEALSRALLESASESIVAADAAGRIVQVNARTEQMFGYPRAELIGQPVELLLPSRYRAKHEGHRASYMAAPRVRPMGQGLDLAGRRKDGTEFPVEVSLSYVQTEEGTRAIAFIIDISERLAFQRAARQADKLAALGTLSAGIAHEINNPIGIISSRVEVMLLEAEGSDLPPEIRKDLDVILRHARRVAAITQGLLSFARVSSGVRGPVNLNRVAEEILQLVQKDMSRAHVVVTMKLDESLPSIVADSNAIGQVLLNLLTNARSAMTNGGGEVTIETGYLPATGSVRLVVRDTGPGIAPEILPKIFDPFFTTKPDGTGLGLSISHGIVHDHHGTLAVRSDVGKGTAFTLTLPVDASPTRDVSRPRPSAP
jgi:PAS domain S-box-containing protein